MTDMDYAISAHAKWLKNEIKFPRTDGDITPGRQELLDTVNSSADGTALVEYLDKKLGMERVITSNVPILSLPKHLSWDNMANSDNKQDIADYFDRSGFILDNWLASLPVYWAAVHYKVILEKTIHGDIRKYFEYESQNSIEVSTRVIHYLGSAPQRFGYYSTMIHCPLGRIWWEKQTAKKVASSQKLTESRAYEIIQKYPTFYRQVLAMSISNLTTLISSEMLTALFTVADNISENRIKNIPSRILDNENFIRKWVREIGKTFYGKIPEYMEWKTVLSETEKSLRKAYTSQ